MRPSRRALLVALCATALESTGRTGAQELPVIRAVGPNNDGFTPVYYGIDSGLFRRYGINVQLLSINSGAAATAAVMGGSAEVAYTNILSVLQGGQRNVPIQIVAPSVLYQGGKFISGVLVLKDAPYRSAKDLNGKTISSPAVRDLSAASILAWIDKNGGDSKTVHIVEVPAASALPYLQDRRIDAAMMVEPQLSRSLATGTTRVFCSPYEAIAPRFLVTAFAANGDYVAQNRDSMTRFARAMHEAIVYVNSHPSDTVDLVAKHTGMLPEQVAHSVRAVNAEYVDPRMIDPVLDVCVKYGILDHAFPAAEVISPVALKAPS